MSRTNIIKECKRENYIITEYDDGSIEEVFDATLLENSLSEEEQAEMQKQLTILNYKTLSKSDKQHLNLESKLDYISTLLEYVVANIK